MSIEFVDCLLGLHGKTVRGEFRTYSNRNARLRFSVFHKKRGDTGSEVSILCSYSNKKTNVRAWQFSFRLPERVDDYCFEVRDEQGKLIESAVLDAWSINSLVARAKKKTKAGVDPNYFYWRNMNRISQEVLDSQREYVFKAPVKFSIVVPLYKTPLNFFKEMVRSVVEQTYSKWELVLVNASPEDSQLSKALKRLERRDSRVIVVTLEKNYGITENTNHGIEVSGGDFVCFLDHDDVLEPNILYEYALAIEADSCVDMLYCDEDHFSNEVYYGATFKPDFNLELLRCSNYICHMLAVRKSIIDSLSVPDSSYDGSQDYYLSLRASVLARKIHHVDKILYHWRESPTSTAGGGSAKVYAIDAGVRALQEHYKANSLDVDIYCDNMYRYTTLHRLEGEPWISIIISEGLTETRNLSACLSSLENLTYKDFDVVLAFDIDVVPEQSFKVSKVESSLGQTRPERRNRAAKAAVGDYLVFIDDSSVVQEENFLEHLIGPFARKDVGAVGGLVILPDKRVEHYGFGVIDNKVVRIEPYNEYDNGGYCFWGFDLKEISGIDSNCMAISKELFMSCGGFGTDVALLSGFALCQDVRSRGLKVLQTPWAATIHNAWIPELSVPETYESYEIAYNSDLVLLHASYANIFIENDPMLNRNCAVRGINTYGYELRWRDGNAPRDYDSLKRRVRQGLIEAYSNRRASRMVADWSEGASELNSSRSQIPACYRSDIQKDR